MASPLKYLRPVAGPHAIQEVVFNVFIAKDTPIEEPASFESLHSGRLKTEFPRFQRIETSVATMNLDAKETQLSSPVCVGFTFEKYRENGELIQRLRGETRPDQTMVFVNLLEYSSWAKVSEKSLRWLRKVANHQKNIMFDGVGLHYID
ncbi:MAG: hypothetical protein ISR51_08640, partial [Rhodospirillales bacterium]|nr:hypothetical protein [Rhodospirillales bacterium]